MTTDQLSILVGICVGIPTFIILMYVGCKAYDDVEMEGYEEWKKQEDEYQRSKHGNSVHKS